MDQLFDEWVDWGTPMEHLASWWPNRHEPFVLLVHYADLIRDLGGEMRRIADFLDIDIPVALWSEVVERCRFESMKSQHEASEILNVAFSEGATAFFNQGTNGRWRAQLSEAQLRRHERLAAERLPEDAALWLEHGSLALGQRP
jgi:aryl sulfotransferase